MAVSPDASPEKAAITQLLIDWKSGNKEALDHLVPLVYQKLRGLADHYLRDERDAATIQPTALVHEAYLRLVSQALPDWESRPRFFGVAAHLMRQILVDHADRRRSSKRGSGEEPVRIEDAVTSLPGVAGATNREEVQPAIRPLCVRVRRAQRSLHSTPDPTPPRALRSRSRGLAPTMQNSAAPTRETRGDCYGIPRRNDVQKPMITAGIVRSESPVTAPGVAQ
jgi:hypothetical protein